MITIHQVLELSEELEQPQELPNSIFITSLYFMQDADKGESIAETMGFTKKPHFPLAMTVILCYNISYIINHTHARAHAHGDPYD